LQEGTHYSPALGEEEWEGAPTTSFVPIAVERPGGGRIQNKRDPNPADIVIVRGVGGKRVPLHQHAAAAWQALVAKARAAGIQAPSLLPVSGFRSRAHQSRLWQAALKRYGSPSTARRWVAPPGGSAHQSGRAIDFYLGGKNSSKNVAYLRTLPAYRWLADHAQGFGFYPYANEPWHWEYNPPAR
jgi:LAS superfamily LD-carboxypeptidase LdcB